MTGVTYIPIFSYWLLPFDSVGKVSRLDFFNSSDTIIWSLIYFAFILCLDLWASPEADKPDAGEAGVEQRGGVP